MSEDVRVMDSEQPECRASKSGGCLMLYEGMPLCAEGECDEGAMNDWRDTLRADPGPPPRRATRKPRRGALPSAGQLP